MIRSGIKRSIWLTALLCLAAAAVTYFIYSSTPVDYVPFLQERLERRVDIMEEEATTLAPVLSGQSVRFDELPKTTTYTHVAYRDGRLVYWSDYRYVPEYEVISSDSALRFVTTPRHDMIVLRSMLEGGTEIYSFLTLADHYKIDNNYLRSGIHEEVFGTDAVVISTEGEKICVRGECLFSVELLEPLRRDFLAAVTLILGWLALVLIFIGLVSESWTEAGKGRKYRGFVQLVIGLAAVRALMLFTGYPDIILETILFDSRYFASSSFNPSLGDLFLNLVASTVLLVYVVVFLRSDLTERISAVRNRFIVTVILCGLLAFVFHYQYLFLQTLYNNSQLSFDINESIQFDILRLTGFGVIILNAAISFMAFHLLFGMIRSALRDRRLYFPLITGMLLFAAVNLLIGQAFLISLLTAFLYALVLHHSGLDLALFQLRYRTFLYLFTGIVFTALLFTSTIHTFENKRELDRKEKFANQFLIENDNMAEFLLNEAVNGIREDVFIQSRLTSPFMPKDIIRSKIRQVYLSNYFDKYDVSIHLFNPNLVPYDIPSDIPPQEIRSWRSGEYGTSYSDIYFINRLEGQAAKRYIALVDIERRGIIAGYIMIDMTLKRIIPDNVYPELLVDSRFLEPYEDADYSYAVMENQRITYHAGEFNYQKLFQPGLLGDEGLYTDGISLAGYDHLGIRANQGKVVVISSREHPVAHLISNFSFFFLVLVSLVLIVSGIYALYYYFQNVDLTYTAKIQIYLNIAFFLPLIAVSLTTLSVINSSFRNDQQEEYYRRAENIGMNISVDLEQYLSDLTVDTEQLPKDLNLIGNVTGVDVNLFTTRGRLLATSQPSIYENELLSSYINPEALAEIRDGGSTFFITEESVGALTYNNTFFGVRSSGTGRLIGILSIPFFESASELEQSQIEVLTNVMNIFTVIFIVFLILSSLASDWLTFPLRFITQKLKKTTLTGFNEPLTWKTDDEIGLMVREYNRMLDNLEDSKKALARSQKETAWREIAQQVAHEIKNPLTPMKLTLQHLSRRLGEGQDELKKPIQSLLQQVDTLSDIASSFSSFAKLPIPEHERYEITRILRNTAQLYSSDDRAEINLDLPDLPVYSMGDEKLMGRILSNIVLNAIQSYTDGRPRVDITLKLTERSRAVIEVRDYGHGIDESIHGKIFIPNFTTKETGSGIGLAVAKHGVEHAGGKIWFETKPGEGSAFFIELPVTE